MRFWMFQKYDLLMWVEHKAGGLLFLIGWKRIELFGRYFDIISRFIAKVSTDPVI